MRKSRQFVINEETANLIFELEGIIGAETYNPNSVDGYAGDIGRQFRYPLTYDSPDGEWIYKSRALALSTEMDSVDEGTFKTMRYLFGSNHLYIGIGISKVLNHLENRYKLDFAKLERKYQDGINAD